MLIEDQFSGRREYTTVKSVWESSSLEHSSYDIHILESFSFTEQIKRVWVSSSGVGKSVPAIFQSSHATGKETELNMRRRTQEKVIDFSRYKYSVTKKKKLPCLQKVSWFRKPHLFTKFGDWEQTSSLIAFATNGN